MSGSRIDKFKIATVIGCLFFAGPVVSQESTSAKHLGAMLEDLRDWPPDSAEVPSKMAKKWGRDRKAKKKYSTLFEHGGDIESIQFLDTFQGSDVYWVRFQKARLVVLYKRDEDGMMTVFRSFPFGLRRR